MPEDKEGTPSQNPNVGSGDVPAQKAEEVKGGVGSVGPDGDKVPIYKNVHFLTAVITATIACAGGVVVKLIEYL